MMPLFHVGGIVRNLFAPILSGGGVIMCAGFDGVAFWSLCKDLGATWSVTVKHLLPDYKYTFPFLNSKTNCCSTFRYYAAPTMHHAILASRPEGVDPATHTRIRMICNAAGGLLPSLAVELRDTFGGAVILPSYGMTE
jgi:acyl-CoA synthetase (AMP-forming)/AMP-acid ligase II